MKSLINATAALCLVWGGAASAIIRGTPDDGAHPQVGEVYNLATSCSGTLIAPDVFLTAGHCTEALIYYQETYGLPYYVSFAQDVAWPQPDLLAVHAVTHPMYSGGKNPSDFMAFDVGLVFLAEPVTGVTYGTLPSAGALSALPRRTLLELVGYGARGFSRGGGPRRPGGYDSRHVAFAELILVNENNEVLEDQMIRFSESKGHDLGGACYGDSGGPIFRPSTLEILALTSWGHNTCSGIAHGQRLDHPDVLQWIASYLD